MSKPPAHGHYLRIARADSVPQGRGPARAERLKKLGIHTVSDLLFFFPRSYEDLTKIVRICEFEEDTLATAICTVDDVGHRTSANMKSIVTVIFRDGTGFIRATWFNQAFMKDKFAIGDRVVVSGKPKRVPLNWEMSHPRVRKIGTATDASAWSSANHPQLTRRIAQDAVGVLPVYRLTDGINQRQMRQMVESALEVGEANDQRSAAARRARRTSTGRHPRSAARHSLSTHDRSARRGAAEVRLSGTACTATSAGDASA